MTNTTDKDALLDKIALLEIENKKLHDRLFTYINPEAKKKYYQANKDKVNAKSKEYMKNVDSEKRKKWNHTAYLNRKKKLIEQQNSVK
jgi:cobalamin biosynthesis protein CbiD